MRDIFSLMPKLTLLNDGSVHEFELDAIEYGDHGKPGSILDIAMFFDLPLNHSCGGFCSCTTCHVLIKEGAENVSPAEEDELDLLDMLAGGTPQSRLACQTLVKGDVTIEIPR